MKEMDCPVEKTCVDKQCSPRMCSSSSQLGLGLVFMTRPDDFNVDSHAALRCPIGEKFVVGISMQDYKRI